MLIGTPTMFLDLCGYVERIPVEERRQYLSPELVLSGGAICSSELVRKIKTIFNAKVQVRNLCNVCCLLIYRKIVLSTSFSTCIWGASWFCGGARNFDPEVLSSNPAYH